jgi:hypothetical protein
MITLANLVAGLTILRTLQGSSWISLTGLWLRAAIRRLSGGVTGRQRAASSFFGATSDWLGSHMGLRRIPLGWSWCGGYIKLPNARLPDERLNVNNLHSL